MSERTGWLLKWASAVTRLLWDMVGSANIYSDKRGDLISEAQEALDAALEADRG